MMKKLGFDGVFHAVLTSKNGETRTYRKHNSMLDSGFDLVVRCLIEEGTSRPSPVAYIALGLDDTESQSSMIGLGEELASQKATASYDSASKSITFEAHFGADVTGAITEAGLRNAESVFLDRSTFELINKSADDELTVRFIIALAEYED